VLTWTACERAPDATSPRPVAEPRLELGSEALSFPGLLPGETAVETLEARNVGDAPLQFDRIEIPDSLAFELVSSTDAIEVEPGGVYPIEIAFTAMTSGENTGTLTLESNAANDPTAEVALVGAGRVPLLRVTPTAFTFDPTEVPCGAATELQLESYGTADLVVTDLRYEAGGALTLDPTGAPLPWTLAPGESRFVWVRFASRWPKRRTSGKGTRLSPSVVTRRSSGSRACRCRPRSRCDWTVSRPSCSPSWGAS
jgi:hypothetical protein